MRLFSGILLSGSSVMVDRLIDVALIVCVTAVALYTAYSYGEHKGYTDGQIQGYMMTWSSVWEGRYNALLDSVNYYCR